MYRLNNPARPYEWGSRTAIAEFFMRPVTGGREAEVWLGAHPGSPSTVSGPERVGTALDVLIREDPCSLLGKDVAARFDGTLPFLAKVLAAESPLSLQVHPTKEQAQRGFTAEESAGIPLNSPQRTYKDTNHKPEMIIALSDFEALCGFRAPAESRELFGQIAEICAESGENIDELAEIVRLLGLPSPEEALKQAFTYIISGAEGIVPTVHRVAEQLAGKRPVPVALSEVVSLYSHYPGDPGVLLSLMLNHVTLKPGESLCLPAGNVHAYLRGLGLEVMASSDNVIRGGLTPKHIDVQELLRTVDFRELSLPVSEPLELAGSRRWVPPFEEFQVEYLEIFHKERMQLQQRGPVILLAVTGRGEVTSASRTLTLSPEDSLFIPAFDGPVVASSNDDNSALPFTFFAISVGSLSSSNNRSVLVATETSEAGL